MGENRFKFGIAAGDNVADDSEVGLGTEVFLPVTLVEDDAAFAQEVGHGGVNGLVGAGDLQAEFPEHGGHRAHAGTGDAEEVEVLKFGAVEHGQSLGWRRRADQSSGKPKTGEPNPPLWPAFPGPPTFPFWGLPRDSCSWAAPKSGCPGKARIPR